MTEFLIVRHPEAYRRIDEPHGGSYGLTGVGREQAVLAGNALKNIADGRIPDGIECAPSLRSREASKLMIGIWGVSTTIVSQPDFRHSGLDIGQLCEQMNSWVFSKNAKHGGLYVACVSRRVVASLAGLVLDWQPDEIDNDLHEGGTDIPTGSITKLTVRKNTLRVDYVGLTPDEAVARRAA